MSKLLINENPLQVLPSLAVKYGLNEAIIIQQLHYWLNKSNHVIDGRTWVYNTFNDWQEQFPFWSVLTIKRLIKKLRANEMILTANYNKSKMDRTLWYSLNYGKLQGDTAIVSECYQDGISLIPTIPETTTETTTENKKTNKKVCSISLESAFDDFRKIYPGTKRGLQTEFENFKKKHKDWKAIVSDLKGLLECQINEKACMERSGIFVPPWKHLSTYINQRCWEEELQNPQNANKASQSTAKDFFRD